MQLLFLIPPGLGILLIAGLMTIPFYFFNQYLQQKIKPRESGKKLLLYFIIVIATIFLYITAGIYVIIAVAKYLQ
ncbi:MAG: hypothetical protein IPP48_16345 [Chitinophagaceae bacterium]|nr:hypothetical protein [Chitinophagaceae bacterium]